MTEQDYLTLKQAAKFTGKSERTMRRFVEGIVKGESENAAADRYHILPSAKQKEAGSTDAWRIDLALLRVRFPEAEQQQRDDADTGSTDKTIDRLLSIVEKQAETQSTTIEEQSKRIDDLTGKLEVANQEIDDLKLKLLPAGDERVQHTDRKDDDSEVVPAGELATREAADATKKQTAKRWWQVLRA